MSRLPFTLSRLFTERLCARKTGADYSTKRGAPKRGLRPCSIGSGYEGGDAARGRISEGPHFRVARILLDRRGHTLISAIVTAGAWPFVAFGAAIWAAD